MPARETIAILGGSFDPVHQGHLVAASFAIEQLACKRLLLIPNNQSPLKQAQPRVSFQLRLTMLQLAAGGHPTIEVSELEGQRPGPSYTVDTLEALQRKNPESEFVLILGEDALADFSHWKDVPRLRQLARIAGIARVGESSALPGHADLMIDMPRIDISSTMIRERVASGLSIDFLTPAPVVDFIRANRLYQAR
jgi:nicotinate-nucleotide adenylyltransferase